MAKKTSLLNRKNLSVAPIARVKVEEKKESPSVLSLLEKAGGAAEESEPVAEINPEVNLSSAKEVGLKNISSIDELLGELSEVDKRFENVTDADYYKDKLIKVDDDLDLDMIEVPEVDEKGVADRVTAEETLKAEQKKNNEIEKAKQQQAKKEAEIETLKSDAETTKTQIGEIYDDYKATSESDMVKRGLARSSVAVLTMDNIEASRAKELSRVAENLTSAITNVEGEIADLRASLDVSLENLDLELAENISSSIEKKIAELKEKQQEAIEFNNSVKKIQAEYKLKLDSKKKEAAEFEQELAEKYEGAALRDKEEQKLELAIDYFGSLDKFTALSQIIGNSELARSLGDRYYDLYYYIMRG